MFYLGSKLRVSVACTTRVLEALETTERAVDSPVNQSTNWRPWYPVLTRATTWAVPFEDG